MQTCSRCEAPNPEDATLCASCGFPLTLMPMVSARPLPPRPAPVPTMAPMPRAVPVPPAPLARTPPRHLEELDKSDDEPLWRAYLLAMPDQVDWMDIAGRGAVWLLLALWTVLHLRLSVEHGEMNEAWMHRIHLVFHEAGHVIFGIFGDFIGVLGGTLGQLVMPLLFLVAFVGKYRNAFGGAVALWWIGDSLVDVAPYAYDARAQELLLLGGVTGKDVPGYHDWNNMLEQLGWLQHDHLIGNLSYALGAACMVAALLWGAWLLWAQSRVARQNVL